MNCCVAEQFDGLPGTSKTLTLYDVDRMVERANLEATNIPSLFDDLCHGACKALTPYEIRCRIAYLQQEIEKIPGAVGAEAFQVWHHYDGYKYTRQIFLPAGMIIIGGLHRYSHFNKITAGKVTMVTEHGGVELLEGACEMISPAGTKRALIVHEDTYWMTEHTVEDAGLIVETKEWWKMLEELGGPILAKNYTELGMIEPDTNLLMTHEIKGKPSNHERALEDAQ